MMSLREDGVEKRSLVCGLWGVIGKRGRLFCMFLGKEKGGKAGVSCIMESKRYLLLENFPPAHLEGCSKKRLGIVKKLEVNSGFCKRHASRSLSLFPFVRMIYAGC